MKRRIGILALQGAVDPHVTKFREIGVEHLTLVKRPVDLEEIHGLVIPGGESTTMLKLLKLNQLWEPLAEFVKHKPSWGTCAGAILLAKHVSNPKQDSLGAIDLDITRNAYGRQLDSFVSPYLIAGPAQKLGKPGSRVEQEGVFIRAPILENFGKDVEVLLLWEDRPVMIQSRNILISTFHPELGAGHKIHSFFLDQIAK